MHCLHVNLKIAVDCSDLRILLQKAAVTSSGCWIDGFLLRLSVPSTRTAIGSRSFRVAAPSVWNSLPQHLRADSLSQQQFKNGLKTHLFKVAYLDNSSENYWRGYLLNLTYYSDEVCFVIFKRNMVANWTLQQDGTPSHTARKSIKFCIRRISPLLNHQTVLI